MAATITVIKPATGSKANTTNYVETDGHDYVVVSAPGLATTEEVDIYTVTPGGYALFGLTSGVFKLTASIQSIELPAGPRYAFAKDATAGSVGVFVTLGSKGQA